MKRKPTRAERVAIQKDNPSLNLSDWLVRKNTQGKVELVHRLTGTRKWVYTA